MHDDLTLEKWNISCIGSKEKDDFLESIFFTGNGRIGIRGYLPVGRERHPVETGMFCAGIFGELGNGITDIVNLPSPVFDEILFDGKKTKVVGLIQRELDIKKAVLKFCYTLSDGDKSAEVTYERFLPITHPGLIMQRTKIEPLQQMKLTVKSGLSTKSCN